MKTDIYFSYAKINLGLKVINKRVDNYHNIKSYFFEIDLYDELHFKKSKKFNLIIEGLKLPTKNNLITKAYNLLKESSENIDSNYSIYLKKRIPLGGGLGGGSSNAGITLLALNKLWKLNKTPKELEDLAINLGSDIPFFINGGVQLIEGTGNILTKIKHIKIENYYFLLVLPKLHISTPWAYEKLNKSLEVNKSDIKFPTLSLPMKWELFENDFERVIRKTYPEIGDIKRQLLNAGALFSSLSGSGSTVFGIFNNIQKAELTLREFSNYQTFLASPVYR